MPSPAKSLARDCLREEVETSGLKKGALAQDVCDGEETTFSKMLAGTRPFDVGLLDALPYPVRIAWLKRYAQENGLHVREVDLLEQAEQLIAQFRLIERAVQAWTAKRQMVRAGLPEPQRQKAVG